MKKKVLVVTPEFNRFQTKGGLAMAVSGLCKYLSRDDYDVKVIMPDNDVDADAYIVFEYTPYDNDALENCSLVLNGTIVNTTNSPDSGVQTSFIETTLVDE